MHRAFLYISLPSLNDCNTKLPIFTCPLYGVDDHNRKFSFSFAKLRCAVLLDSTHKILPTFDIKLNETE